jgi:integrase
MWSFRRQGISVKWAAHNPATGDGPAVGQIRKDLRLPPIRLHDLPHGAATLALASRTDLKVIQRMLGHSSQHRYCQT